MKRAFLAVLLSALALTTLMLSSCAGTLAIASEERVTFALVMGTRTYTGKTVIADIKVPDVNQPDPLKLPTRETVQAVVEDYPNTARDSWAKLTTLDKLPTNARYAMVFFIDMDGSGTRTTGDLSGVHFFDVMPGATWAESKYFVADLTAVP